MGEAESKDNGVELNLSFNPFKADKNSPDDLIVKSFFMAATGFFLFWLITLFYTTRDFWSMLKFQNNSSLSFGYFFISLLGFVFFSYLVMSKDSEDFLEKTLKNKYLLFIVILLCISFFIFNTKIFVGENWATTATKVITGICDQCPERAYQVKYITTSALASFSSASFAKALYPFNINPLESLHLFSKLIGVLFVIILYIFSRKYYAKHATPFFLLIFISTGLITFFGTATHTDFIGWIFLLLYFTTSLLHIEKKTGLFLPSLFLSLSMLSHLSASNLLPSLLYVAFYDKISFENRKLSFTKKTIIPTLVTVLAGLILPYAIFYSYVSYDLAHNAPQGFTLASLGAGDGPGGAGQFVPLTEAERVLRGAHYTMFSLPHLTDVFSYAIFLQSFRFLFMIFASLYLFKVFRKDPKFNFLLLANIFMLLLLSVWHNNLTPHAKMWETYLFTILPACVFTAYLILDKIQNEATKKRIAFLAILLVLISVIPWIVFAFSNQQLTAEQSTLTYTFATQGIYKNNTLKENPNQIKRGDLVVFSYFNLAGFKKNSEGNYDTEENLYLQDYDWQNMPVYLEDDFKDLGAAMLPPITNMIQDYSYQGSSFGIIPKELDLPVNTSSFPVGRYNLMMEIKDKVSGAVSERYLLVNVT